MAVGGNRLSVNHAVPEDKGAEEVGKVLIKRVVAPHVSFQAVDEFLIACAELLLAAGPVFCKQDAKCRMRKQTDAL